jgi:formate hydrogenlyase transcriptional activator
MSAELSIDGACHASLDAVERVFGASSSWIMLQEPQTRTLRVTVFRGRGADVYRDVSIPLDRAAVLARVCRERRILFVPDVRQEAGWFDVRRLHASGLRSLFIAPLVLADRVLGVLALDAPRFTEGGRPGPVDGERLEALAAQMAIAIANARLFEANEQDRARLRALIKQQKQLSGQVTHLQREAEEASGGPSLIGETTCFLEVLHQVELVARADTTVLFTGETGTGKEGLARLVHQRSRRAGGPFIAVNCAALPEHLVESELFGHERGAFTGAVGRKPGSFEIADRGTIFLDEVGDLPLEAQAKLLRVLQDREVRRVGATRPVTVDVRVVAATNQYLHQAIAEHRFRPDLFYRLGVFPISVPPLRDRLDDIPLLALHFLKRYARRFGKPVPELASDALMHLVHYDWPGNVRELQNVLERAVILSDGERITPESLYLPHRQIPVATGPPRIEAPVDSAVAMDASLPAQPPAWRDGQVVSLADAERLAILNALNTCRWRISGRDGAASCLRMKPTTLHAKMKKLGIRRPAPFVAPAT